MTPSQVTWLVFSHVAHQVALVVVLTRPGGAVPSIYSIFNRDFLKYQEKKVREKLNVWYV